MVTVLNVDLINYLNETNCTVIVLTNLIPKMNVRNVQLIQSGIVTHNPVIVMQDKIKKIMGSV